MWFVPSLREILRTSLFDPDRGVQKLGQPIGITEVPNKVDTTAHNFSGYVTSMHFHIMDVSKLQNLLSNEYSAGAEKGKRG